MERGERADLGKIQIVTSPLAQTYLLYKDLQEIFPKEQLWISHLNVSVAFLCQNYACPLLSVQPLAMLLPSLL